MYIDFRRLVFDPFGFKGDLMFRPIAAAVSGLGFVDLMPGSGQGSGGYVNVASFELYGTPVKRGGGH